MILLLISLFFLGPSLGGILPLSQKSPSQRSMLAAFPSAPKLGDIQTYQGLSVGRVEEYKTPNSRGTVIYLPQYHKSPGSNSEDKINDAGASSQQQIYQIINFLVKRAGVDLVMVEGSLYGPVPPEKITLLKEKIQKRDTLISLLESLNKAFQEESLNPSREKKLLDLLDTEIAKIDREIVLEGAAEKYAAEGHNIKLLGSENPATKEEAKLVVRDFIFLQDRIKQLDHPQTAEQPSASSFQDNSVLKLLFQRKSLPAFEPLQSEAATQGKEYLVKLLQDTAKVFYDLENKFPKNIMLSTTSDTPSRRDNPYKNTRNKKALQEKLAQTKEQMETVVVEKRNRDTAENFAQSLKQEEEPVGILQFGAGHKEGLIEELQKQGLSVIVITSREISGRGKS